MTIQQVRDALYTWLNSQKASATEVIYRDDNGPRGTGLYLAFTVSANPKTGTPEQTLVDQGSGNQSVITHSEAMVNVQSYRDGAMDELVTIRDSLGKNTVLESLRASGVFFRRIAADVTDIATVLDATFEERATMDLVFGIKNVATDNVDYIETVELEPQGDLVIP